MSQDKTPPAKDAGAEYAEIWGEAIPPTVTFGRSRWAWHCGGPFSLSSCFGLQRSIPPAHRREG